MNTEQFTRPLRGRRRYGINVIQAQSREAPLIGCEGNHFYVYLTAGAFAGTGKDAGSDEEQGAEDGNGLKPGIPITFPQSRRCY